MTTDVELIQRSRTAVALSSGRYVLERMPSSWVQFAALSLVTDDSDDWRRIGRVAAKSATD